MTFILKRLCLIASALVVGAGFNAAFAQLPPTINRISAKDSAVDVCDLTGQSFVVDSFSQELGTAIAPRSNSIISPSDARLSISSRPFTVEL